MIQVIIVRSKINKLARGIFNSTVPEIVLSERRIEKSLNCLPKEILKANKDFIHQLKTMKQAEEIASKFKKYQKLLDLYFHS